MSPRKILVTGVYGLIAGAIYGRFREEPGYDVYGLARRRQPSDNAPDDHRLNIPDDKFHLVDLTDWDGLLRAMERTISRDSGIRSQLLAHLLQHLVHHRVHVVVGLPSPFFSGRSVVE